VVLFLVSAVERNIYEQRSLQYHVCENQQGIKIVRRTLQQIRTGGFLSPTKQLIVSVSLVALSAQLSVAVVRCINDFN